MPLRRPIVLGNWKMNGLRCDGMALAGDLATRAVRLSGTLGVFPPATLLAQVVARLGKSGILVGGQDCHQEASGAFTGCISAAMLADAGATATLVGHSERRHGLGESDQLVRAKASAALEAGLQVVLCIGETEEQYANGKTLDVLDAQVAASLPDEVDEQRLIVAYEPVWAIGTGRTPTIDEIGRTHAQLRAIIGRHRPGASPALLYGGSVKPANAADIMTLADVDGVLVGGASLDAEGFWRIYTSGGGA